MARIITTGGNIPEYFSDWARTHGVEYVIKETLFRDAWYAEIGGNYAGKDVMLIEPSDVTATPVTDGLSSRGVNVHYYPTAEKALEAYFAVNPDLVIATFSLPGMKVPELLRRIRELEAKAQS